jgi:hypothetical protein
MGFAHSPTYQERHQAFPESAMYFTVSSALIFFPFVIRKRMVVVSLDCGLGSHRPQRFGLTTEKYGYVEMAAENRKSLAFSAYAARRGWQSAETRIGYRASRLMPRSRVTRIRFAGPHALRATAQAVNGQC